MPEVYKDNHETLEGLLDQASNAQGASLLIPDLQRPYVWTPLQVVYLVDSLVRGWPFGSLLLWSVSEQSVAKMPSRQFATLIDRTGGADLVVPQQQAPANYRMVLDGQQRVQSLLLAFGGDSWGFKLDDRAWHESINQKRPRGRFTYRHWSVGELCVDLDQLRSEFAKAKSVPAMEFAKVLRWAVRDPKNGQSPWPKKSNYEEPLHLAHKIPGHYVRLSRLWNALKGGGAASISQLKEAAQKILVDHQVAEPLRSQALEALMEIIQALQGVKKTRVTFLEVSPYNAQEMGTPEAYSDAVVSIFTRLNTAGRTLTREEITFAWVKSNWDASKTDQKGAAECFQSLADKLKEDHNIAVSLDELVSAVSLVWAVHFNDGRMLSNADLLKGETIRPMAQQLAEHWTKVKEAVLSVCSVVQKHDLVYGNQYQSLNSLALLWAWRFIGVEWQSANKTNEPDKDAWNKIGADAMDAYFDRWLLISQWSGSWGESATASLTSIVATLTAADKAVSASKSMSDAGKAWQSALVTVVDSFTKAAADHIETLDVDAREFVRAYYLPLWVWHRLEEKRWKASSVPLRTRKSGGTLDVDHIVSVGLTSDLGGVTESPTDAKDGGPPVVKVNALGNCWLLETNFNISKGKQAAQGFLNKVVEFKDQPAALETWRSQIGLSADLLNPTKDRLKEVATAIDERTTAIRKDLKDFISGTVKRVDIASGANQN